MLSEGVINLKANLPLYPVTLRRDIERKPRTAPALKKPEKDRLNPFGTAFDKKHK